jgi:hypothetical protein
MTSPARSAATAGASGSGNRRHSMTGTLAAAATKAASPACAGSRPVWTGLA